MEGNVKIIINSIQTMKILITGAEGQVGSELVHLGKACEHEISGLSRSKLDIVNLSQINHCVESLKPDVVINAAAYTAVEKAETDTDRAFLINRDGPKTLANVCSKKIYL